MPTSTLENRRPRAAHLGPERRRPQVLDAALDIALESGVGAVTLVAVAQRLKVTRPVVYSCFDNREALIQSLLKREEDRLLESVLAALHSARGDDPEAAFIQGYQALLRAVAEYPKSWQLVFLSNADPTVAARFAAARRLVAESALRWLRPVLTRWWGMSDVDHKLPVLVELFMSSCEAAMRVFLTPSNTWSADELGEFFGCAMCRALRGA